jgi:vanillate O-demethylase ferredoxin subunit
VNIETLSEDTLSFEFEIDEGIFESVEPGTHIDVYLENGLIKQYSLWDWSDDHKRISVAVKREDNGVGGSKAMHQLKEGQKLELDGPRNNFKLIPNAAHYTLVAGGIGVTPIFSMVKALRNQGANFDVYYLVQKRELAAFASHFEALILGDNYHLHSDEESDYIDFKQLLSNTQNNSVIYACGPEPMLNVLISANENHELHYEKFSASSDKQDLENLNNESFEVKVNSTGNVYEVGADDTILSVLTDNGITVASACTSGVCGTCITDVLEGDIDHRDEILSEEEKATNENMCVCVSRAKSQMIVLDL